MDYKEQLLSVYPNCKANVGHSRVTIVEIYDTVRNDAELKRRTEAYRQAMEAKEAGKVLKAMKTENFPMLAFWTKPNVRAPYLCIEPWQGCAAYDNESGDFTDKPYCVILAAGESLTSSRPVLAMASAMAL